MGVQGLQSFLKNNRYNFGTQSSLNHTNLVIDGMNVAWYLVGQLCNVSSSPYFRSFIHGFDYVAYSVLVRTFFDALDKCSIKPILVYDGSVIGDESDGKESKERTILKRAEEKFEYSRVVQEHDMGGDMGRMLMPKNVIETFKSICTDLNLTQVQKPFEADCWIANIANERNCLVLTNDSDFIIYRLNQGFIILDFFEFRNVIQDRNGQNSISCIIFSQRNLCRVLPGLQPENLPLMSVLLGNDYVDSSAFCHIIDSICNVPYNGNLVTQTRTHARIANLINWLRTHSLDEAKSFIYDQVHPNARSRLHRVITKLLQSYKINADDNFRNRIKTIFPDENALDDDPDLLPSNYLSRMLELHLFSSIGLDILFHNTYYNYLVVEDWRLPTVDSVTYRSLSVLVTILRPSSYINLTAYRKKIAFEEDALIMFNRVGQEYRKLSIRPIERLDGFGSLENLNMYTFIVLEPQLKKSLLMSIFRFNNDEYILMRDTLSIVFTGDYLVNASICMILMKFIGLETGLSPKPQFIESLILTLLYYAFLNGQVTDPVMQSEHYGKILLRLKPHETKINNLDYGQYEPSIFRRIVHFINQLQSAIQAFIRMNNMTGNNFPSIRPDYFLNSTLIYRITRGLRFRGFILNELCQNCNDLLDVCASVKIQVHVDE